MYMVYEIENPTTYEGLNARIIFRRETRRASSLNSRRIISYCDMRVFPQTVFLETPFHPLTLKSLSISCTFAKFLG